MEITFHQASADDAQTIAAMVIKLTEEISQLTSNTHFDIDLAETTERCHKLLEQGHYAACIACINKTPIAVATFTETYALYAGGKIGVIQEFYVAPEQRSSGIGAKLLEQVKTYGEQNNWSAIELCTPPLPEFERTLAFYQNNGLKPVGGRKMRQSF